MNAGQVFILNDSHPENIEIKMFPFDDGVLTSCVMATCPRCGAFAAEYGVGDEQDADVARRAVKKLAARSCNVHIGTTDAR